jgi:hypothetical protein
MIVLDTNVISEVVRPAPSAKVITWLNEQNSVDLCVTTITLGEISYGIEALPTGRRRSALATALDQFVDRAFSDRVLVFDRESAREYGQIMADRRRLGRPLAAPDGQIAAITRRHRFQLATRNIKDFDECGIGLINPFADQ